MSSWAASISSRALLGLVEQGAASANSGLLPQQADAGAGVQADFAVVGAVESGEDAQQRGLAGPVGADQSDALAMEQFKRRRLRTAARDRTLVKDRCNSTTASVDPATTPTPFILS